MSSDEKRVSSSLMIRPSVWQQVKIQAILENMEMSEWVERAMVAKLKEEKKGVKA